MKTWSEKQKMLVTSIFCFLLFQNQVSIFVSFFLLSADTVNLDVPKFLLFGKELTYWNMM